PSWSPNSSLLGPNGGGGFMGGVKVPQVDWSKMPAAPNAGGMGGAAKAPGIPGTTDIPRAQGAPVTLSDIQNTFGEQGVAIAKAILQKNPQAPLDTIFSVLQNILGGNSS